MVATQRFYLTPEDDQKTGMLDFAELRSQITRFPEQGGHHHGDYQD